MLKGHREVGFFMCSPYDGVIVLGSWTTIEQPSPQLPNLSPPRVHWLHASMFWHSCPHTAFVTFPAIRSRPVRSESVVPLIVQVHVDFTTSVSFKCSTIMLSCAFPNSPICLDDVRLAFVRQATSFRSREYKLHKVSN
jgi:hypothetical protein